LAGLEEPAGAHFENLVLADLLAWRDARQRRPEILYWRATTGEEVDFVVEDHAGLVAIEVKTTTRPRVDDARHLRTFREEYRKAAPPALLLHAGHETQWLAPGILAAPWWKVL